MAAPWAKVDVYRTVFIGYAANQLNDCVWVWKFPVCLPDMKAVFVAFLARVGRKVFTAHNALSLPAIGLTPISLTL